MSEVNLLETPIKFLKGVGPKKAILLSSELNINVFEDLLNYFPFRYIDRSKFFKVSEINSDSIFYQLKGRISRMESFGKGRGQRLTAVFSDETGSIQLVWFQGIKWIIEKIKTNKEYIIYGKPNNYRGRYTINHPEIEEIDNEIDFEKYLYPVYHTGDKLSISGLNSRGISQLLINLLQSISKVIPENLSQKILLDNNFLARKDAFVYIHFPPNNELLEKSKKRLIFEELFFIQLGVIKLRLHRNLKSQGHIFKNVGKYFNDFYSKYLPFELTNAQKKVIKEIRSDMGKPHQMNRLLQGDVGSGKTLVALLCMLIAADNSYQSALMAPTEILAIQHYNSITKMLAGMDINVAILTGSSTTAQRKIIHKNLLDGTLQIIIGTHALIEDVVKFNNLGFVVIDEQHRFGVAQRAKLWTKNVIPPDVLVMTATPIPRTMAMTLYGDLDYSVIDELPMGRKPIITLHFTEAYRLRVFKFMKEIIDKGHQVYIVYPLIEESETLDLKNLMEGYEAISRSFPLPKYKLGIVHGKMEPKNKDFEMQNFAHGITNILISTTVIEVGVDVPNASLMIIENANRFGLSQLHQLRGRVGRGDEQSYCILMSEGRLSNEAKTRLETMVETSDGFRIADIDLKLRGPGDLQGTQQSGLLDLKIADIINDEKIVKHARATANNLLEDDPNLEKKENFIIKNYLLMHKTTSFDWGKIS